MAQTVLPGAAWRCHTTVRVRNPGHGPSLQDYQVRMVLTRENFDFTQARADAADLRFTDADGTALLPYWIERYDADAGEAVLWVRVPVIPPDTDTLLKLHWGNPDAAAVTDGTRTFEFFDDGADGPASARWTVAAGQSTLEYAAQADLFGSPGGVWHESGCTRRLSPWKQTVYGGAHATYCAWTRPMAIYAAAPHKTFFVFGDADNSPAIGFYDHRTHRFGPATTVGANPDMDAHRNPHLLIDAQGFLYMFYGSHCTATYLARSLRPYDSSEWRPMGVVAERSSYPQPWQLKPDELIVLYRGGGTHDATETAVFSRDGGATWSAPNHFIRQQPKNGCYGVSVAETGAFPRRVHFAWSLTRGDWWQRYHVYYTYSDDGGVTWKRSDGTPYALPITEATSEPIFQSEVPDRGVWLKDIQLDSAGRPYVLFVDGNTRTYDCVWRLAAWTGSRWDLRTVTASDHMYDDGALAIAADDDMRIYAPTTASRQPWADGGEIEEWRSADQGRTWMNTRHLTTESAYCHNHVKAVHNGSQPDFRVFWCYGDAASPPATYEVDLYAYGEALRSPQKLDLTRASLPPGNVLALRQPDATESVARIRDLGLADVAVEARVRTGAPERQHPMLCLRLRDGTHFYGAGLPRTQGRIYRYDGSWSCLAEGRETGETGLWHDWSFRVCGDRLQFAVDGRLLAEAATSDPRAAAGVGVRVRRSSMYLDRLRVRQFSLPEPVAVVELAQ